MSRSDIGDEAAPVNRKRRNWTAVSAAYCFAACAVIVAGVGLFKIDGDDDLALAAVLVASLPFWAAAFHAATRE